MEKQDGGFDEKRAEAFAARVLGYLNGGATALMLSVGHRTGLFDTLGRIGSGTSAAIADAAGLQERYVREWLGAMTTARVVEFDLPTATYRLPAEHAAFLTRAAVPTNLATTAQWLAVLGSVEDDIVRCFAEGGGVPYSAYKRFNEVMAEESEQTTIHGLRDSILPIVPGLVDRLHAGIDVLDLGCGAGRALIHLARSFPASRFVGVDLLPDAIGRAREEASRAGVTNVTFEAADAARLGFADRFDLVLTFDAIHDQADPAAMLANIARALRPDGTYLMQDIGASSHVHENVDHPLGPFLYTVSCMHCMTVSLSAGGAGLGAVWGEQTALAMLADAGFANVELHRLPHDVQNYYYVARKA